MKEFYEPMLYMSTPDHPNTMGVSVHLKEPVDHGILEGVVEDLRARFPYFYIKAIARDRDLFTEENPLAMTVRDTWEPINLNSQESNFHLAAWKHDGNRLAFEISHSLTDGAGVFPYVKSVLYLYLSRKHGLTFDREGFRLPGDDIPDSETGNPFAGLNVDGAEAPLYIKETVPDFLRLYDGAQPDPHVSNVKLSEAQLMQYCRNYDGSPNAFVAVMLARAARRYDPSSEKSISVSVAVDHKAMLGNFDNYRLFAGVVELDFPKDRSLDDLMRACTVARGQIILQAQPENSLWTMKQRKATNAKLSQVPLETKLGIMAKSAGTARWSMAVSYTNCKTFGPLDPYIEELYVLAEPGVADVVCEIACINHCFFLSIGQAFSSYAFIDMFLDELSSVGVDYEVMRKEPFRLCGMAPFEAADQNH